MKVKRELGNILGLKGKRTFEKNYKIFFYLRKRSRINEETYEKQHNKLKCSKLSVFNKIMGPQRQSDI